MSGERKIKTKIYRVNPDEPESLFVDEAAEVLRAGGLVAFPTETVYGLGAAVHRREGLMKIFTVKGRPADNPLILHLYSGGQLPEVAVEIPSQAMLLAEKFWPGPLTMVLPKKDSVPIEVTAGLPTVAVRVPSHPVALRLLEKTEIPVAAPSANLSGRPSPTLGSHVITDLDGKVEMILDAGATGVGVESTVLDLTGEKPRILRPGGVTLEMLEDLLGVGKVEAPSFIAAERPLAPGMKYRHYAPDAPLILFTGERTKVVSVLKEKISGEIAAGHKVAVLAFADDGPFPPEAIFFSLGKREKPEEAAERLFASLRLCNQEKVETIYAVAPSRRGVGEAVFNRLWKAAGGNVVEVK